MKRSFPFSDTRLLWHGKCAVFPLCTVLPYALFQLHLAARFCSSTPLSGAALPPYCASILPHVYAHLQATYW